MKKKLLSILLAAYMLATALAAGMITTNAAIDDNGAYVPGPEVTCGTNRYYFYMPDSWYNEKFGADCAGMYWWGGTDCAIEYGDDDSIVGKWPGYKMQTADKDLSLYYIDCPKDVEVVLFNNTIDRGTRDYDSATGEYIYQYGEEQFLAAKQTVEVASNYYSSGDDEMYDCILDGKFFDVALEALQGDDKTFFGNFADNFYEHSDWGISFNFNNMIFVIDPTDIIPNALTGKDEAIGNWYFYYGNGEYGALPNKEMAKENNLFYNLADYTELIKPQPDPTIPEPTNPDPNPVVPATPDEPIENPVISFDVGSSGWTNVKTVSCHVWRADGKQTNVGTEWPTWGTKTEKCTYDVEKGIATYDLSKTYNIFGKDDGNIYCVMFYANTGEMTYETIMNGSCIGDTMYVTGEMLESPEDSQKYCIEASWRNNPDCGARKRITSTGNIIGVTHPDGETDETMLAKYLIDHCDSITVDTVQSLIDKLNVAPSDVSYAVRLIGDSAEISAIEDVLFACKLPIKYYGDVDGDKEITVLDATAIQKYIVELEVGSPYINIIADVDGDGDVTVRDATEIQKYIVELECPEIIGTGVHLEDDGWYSKVD